jgi:peptide/nickel transport system permease protein
MAALIARRLATSAAVILTVSLLTFLLQSFAPGDVAQTILAQRNAFGSADPQALAQLRSQLGLDEPVLVQYWRWLSRAITGDLGVSPVSGLDVGAEIAARLPVTLSLACGATVLTGVVGVGLGVAGAVRGGRLGRLVDALSLLGSAVPVFWLALVLVTIFAVSLRLLPATGYTPLTESPADWARGLVLPVVTLAAPGIAVFAKHTRDAMLRALASRYVHLLRANGLPERSIIWRHALRNAAIPVVTVAGLTFTAMFAGTVFAEQVFAMPGLGGLATQAATQFDLPTTQGTIVVFTLVVVTAGLLTDLAYGRLDPKVRTR